MSDDPKRILILGHSFVRRLRHFISRHKGSELSENLHLSEPVIVRWFGVGGRMISKTKQHDMHVVRTFRPHIVLLQLGTNDLSSSSPLRVGSDLEDFARVLHDVYHVRVVVVCQTLRRNSAAEFNDSVAALNKYSQVFLEHLPYVYFWKHRGFWNSRENIYHNDGVHLNDSGQRKLYRSYRGAIQRSLHLI